MRFVKNKREIVIVYLYIRRTILTFTPFFDTSSYFNKKKTNFTKKFCEGECCSTWKYNKELNDVMSRHIKEIFTPQTFYFVVQTI